MRKLIVPALLFLIVTAFVYPEVGGANISKVSIKEALERSGAAFDGAEINGFSLLNEKFMGYRLLEETVENLAQRIGNQNIYRISGIDEEDYRQVTLKGEDNDAAFAITIQTYNLPSGPESYLIVNCYIKDSSEDIGEAYEEVKKCFDALKVKKPQISVILTGHFDKKLSEKDMNTIVSSIMSSLDASYTKNRLYDDMLTMTGYSEKLGEYIELGNEKINLNLAMRYSDSDGKTYLWLGTPVITTDY
ncbi:YwmB family TATA-box binding protein [Calorimonas adulescens]|uniref:YwmB family TATA-box binding protein n=1 Tax=Calorimonas adulescens TaxID=2606906 RepID=A0A5D8Q956_9THEO|nr:YwmB family TATA-box binding protein [Calorimonas adulescens]TZE81305.1 hypothetical protein FWJ32_09740 [Calorimonas adulescens]